MIVTRTSRTLKLRLPSVLGEGSEPLLAVKTPDGIFGNANLGGVTGRGFAEGYLEILPLSRQP